MYHVYILQSIKTNRFYVGHTNNLTRRIKEHNEGFGGRYTQQNKPWLLVYSELHPTRSSAMKRELYLKSTRGSQEKKKLANVSARKP